MKKIINPCQVTDGNVFCEIGFADGKLSIHGVIGPMRNGNAKGGCGQINMGFAEQYPEGTRYYTEGWAVDLFAKFLATWERWHLNDMQAGCGHQRAEWDTMKKLSLTFYTWGPKFHEMRRKVEDGAATADEYRDYQTAKTRVHAVTIGFNTPKYETPEIIELLTSGLVRIEKTETKTAGWVTPAEHPEGLLTKPCSVCGYKYGSAWLKEEVPQEVVDFLASLPDSTITPAWV